MSIYFCVILFRSSGGEEAYVFGKIDRNFMYGPVFEVGFKIVIQRHSFEIYINKIYSKNFHDLSRSGMKALIGCQQNMVN